MTLFSDYSSPKRRLHFVLMFYGLVGDIDDPLFPELFLFPIQPIHRMFYTEIAIAKNNRQIHFDLPIVLIIRFDLIVSFLFLSVLFSI